MITRDQILDNSFINITGQISVYDHTGKLQYTQDMHTINKNFLAFMYNMCFRSNSNSATHSITGSTNTHEPYFDTTFIGSGSTDEAFYGMQVATGSYDNNITWYSLDGTIGQDNFLRDAPTVSYRMINSSRLTSSIAMSRHFHIDPEVDGLEKYTITHLGICSTNDNTKYVLWTKDKLNTTVDITNDRAKTFEININFPIEFTRAIPGVIAKKFGHPSGSIKMYKTDGTQVSGSGIPDVIYTPSVANNNFKGLLFGTSSVAQT